MIPIYHWRVTDSPAALVDRALASVHADPLRALALADEVLGDPSMTGLDEVRALWARGSARRELNDLIGARADLERSMEHGAALDRAPLGDICCTLAMVVFYLGDTAGAFELLDRAGRPGGCGARGSSRCSGRSSCIASATSPRPRPRTNGRSSCSSAPTT